LAREHFDTKAMLLHPLQAALQHSPTNHPQQKSQASLMIFTLSKGHENQGETKKMKRTQGKLLNSLVCLATFSAKQHVGCHENL